jgi:hypothetical protein
MFQIIKFCSLFCIFLTSQSDIDFGIALLDSDHFSVKAVIKQKLSVVYKKKSEAVLKWNKINLQNQSKLKEYRSLLHKKLINLVPKQKTYNEWEHIKTAIVDTTRDVIQTHEKPARNEWCDEECKKIIEEKRSKERKKWLN